LPPARGINGYALLIIMMMVTVLLVSLTVVLPSVYVEGQREREEELIFRGNEYQRAIGLFRRRFNRFPSSVKELLRTNGIRFLRRAYPDPMSRDGKWRFIHASVNGALIDSRTQGLPSGLAAGANAQNPAGAQTPGGDSKPPASPTGSQPGGSLTSSFFGTGTEVQGGFIAGVASSSSRESIRVRNHRRHYDEWEFLGLERGAAGMLPAASAPPSAPGQPGSGPGQPAAPGPQAPLTPQLPPLTDQPLTPDQPPPQQ
jgi:type II secretory pathway pseudopilin PulG